MHDLISQGASACPDEDEEESLVVTLPMQAHHAMEKMEEFVHKVMSSAVLKFLAIKSVITVALY